MRPAITPGRWHIIRGPSSSTGARLYTTSTGRRCTATSATLDAAERDFDAAIALQPDDSEAYNSRAHLRTQSPERNHIEQLEQALARCGSVTGQVQLCHALAKEYEDVGEYERSFARLRQGADLKRRHMRYSVETDLAIIERIREVYGPRMFDGHVPGCDDDDAIFVIGMPRTGTTLVERILDSHPSVRSAGELNEFGIELARLTGRLPGGPAPSRLEFVDRTALLDFRALGEAYLRATRPMRGELPRFVDKLPFNYLYAGLIHLALPRARIVSLRRHPMDTCYAVYKQLFRDAYPFSYDLDELGRYYVAYDRLMRHWHAVHARRHPHGGLRRPGGRPRGHLAAPARLSATCPGTTSA